MLTQLPDDIWNCVFSHIDTYADLVQISLACKSLHELVESIGWRSFFTRSEFRLLSDMTRGSHFSKELCWREKVRLAVQPQRNFVSRTFKAHCLARHRKDFTPVVKLDVNKVIVGTGNCLELRYFDKSADNNGDILFCHERSWTLSRVSDHIVDILIPTPGSDLIYIAFFFSGIFLYRLPEDIGRKPIQLLQMHEDATALEYLNNVMSLSAPARNPEHFLVTYYDGSMTLFSTETHERLASYSHFARPWCTTFLSKNVFALGAGNDSPLSLHTIREGSIEQLYTIGQSRSPVYSMDTYTDKVIVSGWYDGKVRLYDLRVTTENAITSFADPLDDSAIYSVKTDGFKLVAGAARHGRLRMWDLRYSLSDEAIGQSTPSTRLDLVGQVIPSKTWVSTGWSAFLGTNRSPVYSLDMDHRIVIAATASELWAMNFDFDKRAVTTTKPSTTPIDHSLYDTAAIRSPPRMNGSRGRRLIHGERYAPWRYGGREPFSGAGHSAAEATIHFYNHNEELKLMRSDELAI